MEALCKCMNCGLIEVRKILVDTLGQHAYCTNCKSSSDVDIPYNN